MDEEQKELGHAHRWTRFQDPVTKAWNHWCVDGDTEHHDEPCEEHPAEVVADWHVTRLA